MIVSTVLLVLAGLALAVLWRRSIARADRMTSRIVAFGFAVRTFAGLALFWISELRFPLGEHLQRGRGLWFFAADAEIYLDAALRAARAGLPAVLFLDRSTQAPSFVQALALFLYAFTESAAAALLLNAFCFVVTCAIVLRWAQAIAAPRTATLLAMTALSLSPSGVLWATQPLKESFFQLVVVALFATCFVWQRAWREGRLFAAVGSAIGIALLLLVLAGVRWYFAGTALVGCVLFFVLAAWSTPKRRVWVALLALPLLAVMARGVVVGGGAHILIPLEKALLLKPEALRELPSYMRRIVPEVRGNLERLGGATAIQAPDGAPVMMGGALAMFVPSTFLSREYRLAVLADIDTLFFDAVFVLGIAMAMRRPRRTSPVFWLIVFVTLVMTLALAYTIPNFGLLFRLRSLILTGCALLPLARRSGGEQIRRDVLDATRGDDLDVRANLGGIRMRDEHAAEAEGGGLAGAEVGLRDAADLAEEAHFAEDREVVRDRDVALR
jgi:hypothetical protein